MHKRALKKEKRKRKKKKEKEKKKKLKTDITTPNHVFERYLRGSYQRGKTPERTKFQSCNGNQNSERKACIDGYWQYPPSNRPFDLME